MSCLSLFLRIVFFVPSVDLTKVTPHMKGECVCTCVRACGHACVHVQVCMYVCTFCISYVLTPTCVCECSLLLYAAVCIQYSMYNY